MGAICGMCVTECRWSNQIAGCCLFNNRYEDERHWKSTQDDTSLGFSHYRPERTKRNKATARFHPQIHTLRHAAGSSDRCEWCRTAKQILPTVKVKLLITKSEYSTHKFPRRPWYRHSRVLSAKDNPPGPLHGPRATYSLQHNASNWDFCPVPRPGTAPSLRGGANWQSGGGHHSPRSSWRVNRIRIR